MQAVFGLIVNNRRRAVDNFVGNFLAAVGWQGVHILDFRRGQLHAAGVANPVFMFFEIGFHFLTAGVFIGKVFVEFIIAEAAPIFRNDNLRIAETLVHIIGE